MTFILNIFSLYYDALAQKHHSNSIMSKTYQPWCRKYFSMFLKKKSHKYYLGNNIIVKIIFFFNYKNDLKYTQSSRDYLILCKHNISRAKPHILLLIF